MAKYNWEHIIEIVTELLPQAENFTDLVDAVNARIQVPRATLRDGLQRELDLSTTDMLAELREALLPEDERLSPLARALLSQLRKQRDVAFSMLDLVEQHDRAPSSIEAAAQELHDAGYAVDITEDMHVLMPKEMPPTGGRILMDHWAVGNVHRYGVMADTHLGNRNARLDVMEAAYDLFEQEGIKLVLHAGNMVDGEFRYNRSELVAHGVEGQLCYAADHYPYREGIQTHFLSAKCHEGWWGREIGWDVGRYMQQVFYERGRKDLAWIGHIERDLALHPDNEQSVLRVFHPGGGSAYALSYPIQKHVECVPLDSEILTTNGWKYYSQLEIGDLVMGYNSETGRCEWTELLGINLYDRAGVITYENDNYVVRCTRDHKWAMEWETRAGPNPNSKNPKPYNHRDQCLSTIDEANATWRRARIIQAAPGPDGPGASWPEHDDVMDKCSAVRYVLDMTSEQRQSFIYGMMVGEGTVHQRSRTLYFSQVPGPVRDAFVLACFLEGRATTGVRLSSKKINSETKVCSRTTILKKHMRMTDSMRETGLSIEPVWCPTTKLGTWVMRQGTVITITGNSWQGGEKPTACIFGHYHKYDANYVREVYCLQPGCQCDQTQFMRMKKLPAHVGFCILEIRLTSYGAIQRVIHEWCPFYDKGYYANIWDFRSMYEKQETA